MNLISLFSRRWNKKLNYVIAIAKDGVYDVTKRYTRKWAEVILTIEMPFFHIDLSISSCAILCSLMSSS